MNEEIKVLSYLQKYIDKNKQDEEWIMKGNILETPAMIGYLETKELLNYITNLQEENNLLKAKIKCMEEKINYKNAYKDESEIYNEFFR